MIMGGRVFLIYFFLCFFRLGVQHCTKKRCSEKNKSEKRHTHKFRSGKTLENLCPAGMRIRHTDGSYLHLGKRGVKKQVPGENLEV